MLIDQGAASWVRRGQLGTVALACAQFLIVFDATGFNVALPSIQAHLRSPNSELAWQLTAYTVFFGALPVFAGEAGKAYGRRRVLLCGLGLSSVAAAVSAATSNAGVLLSARAVQGAGAALTTAGALALIDSTHPQGPARNRALSVHFAVAASAGPVALWTSSILLGDGQWRRLFMVEVAISTLLMLLAWWALTESPRRPNPRLARAAGISAALAVIARLAAWLGNLDLPASAVIALAVAGALVPAALTWSGWSDRAPATLSWLYRHRAAVGVYTVVVLLAACQWGTLFAVNYALQVLGGLSPAATGWSLLPAALALLLACVTLPPVAARVGLRATVTVAAALTAIGLLLLSRTGNSYSSSHVLVPVMLVAFGAGVTALPVSFGQSQSGALPQGLNSSRQLGISLGASLFAGVLTVTAIRSMASITANSVTLVRAAQQDSLHACYQLGAALALAALAVALTTFPGNSSHGGETSP